MSSERNWDQERSEILGVQIPFDSCSTYHLEVVTVEMIEKLIAAGLIDLNENQNGSPSTTDFLEFMKQNPLITAHGYACSMARSDHRITLEGLQLDSSATDRQKLDFVLFCLGADELDETRSWWD